ncbi:hypothetical protein Ddye_004372 [Dipteronia dyeriana]|uniref:C2H2-type domain-containing protein n=1 Tax=Dipteronia dyeriana TaxID=168575 RepID=A0AAD9XVV2_9ROSI|nr:hypothetical protein Ddye_004372 [Dipteronia dyeriana]
MLLEKMAEETISSIGFAQNPVLVGSNPPLVKKKRNLPGNPDPEAEVIALSPKTLMATNRFLCEICGKGFQRDQNLQLHRRGHNLPWKLKQRSSKEVRKRVYVCPEKACVHHHPSRALGDLTGIKKHFCRKHGEKKWKCEKCSKRYAVQSDWKAHSKTCGTREYKCDCGTIFSRRDSFITHRAFCDALAEETARVNAASTMNLAVGNNINMSSYHHHLMGTPLGPRMAQHFSSIFNPISSPTSNETIDQTSQGLSLWMGGQGNNNNLQEIHQLGSSVSSGAMFCTDINPPQADYQLNWVFGSNNKLPAAATSCDNGSEALASTSLPLSDIKISIGTHHQLVSVPSLYSSQQESSHRHHQALSSSANMSATALLQKAAQIGATSTDPSFLGSFGLKSNGNIQVQEGNQYCGLYSTSNTIASSLGSDYEDRNQIQMYPPAKRRHLQSDHQDSSNNGGGRGQTRDFLGVGVQAISCHPSSINGWI